MSDPWGFYIVLFFCFEDSGVTVHPARLTWNLQITHLERNMIFQTSMIVFHVNLPGCIQLPHVLGRPYLMDKKKYCWVIFQSVGLIISQDQGERYQGFKRTCLLTSRNIRDDRAFRVLCFFTMLLDSWVVCYYAAVVFFPQIFLDGFVTFWKHYIIW